MDDFYLTNSDQKRLASLSKNPYLKQRGYPGTHDLPLGLTTLNKLKNAEPCALPVYDKSKYQGQGDRADESSWPLIDAPQEIVILEGWMLGFVPQTKVKDSHLNEINEYLKDYEVWLNFINLFIILTPKKINYVIDWRVEAEKNRSKQGQESMSEEEAYSYIKNFIPAYELYSSSLKSRASQFSKCLTFEIGENRLPL